MAYDKLHPVVWGKTPGVTCDSSLSLTAHMEHFGKSHGTYLYNIPRIHACPYLPATMLVQALSSLSWKADWSPCLCPCPDSVFIASSQSG